MIVESTSTRGLSGDPLPKAGMSPEEAAEKFEGLLMTMLVKELRQSLPGDGLFGSGPGAAIYEGLFDQALAESLSSGGGTGLRQSLLESWQVHGAAPKAVVEKMTEQNP